MPPTATAAQHRALDGTGYRLEGDLDLSAPSTSSVELVAGGRLIEFTAGPADLGDKVAASLGIERFDSELTFQQGTLRTATTTEREPRSGLVERPMLICWSGKRHSLVTRLYGSSPKDVLALLRTLRIDQSAEEGLTLTPDRAAGSAYARPATVIKEVPGLGLLEMSRRTKEHSAQLPTWKGVSVPAGELFRDNFTDGRPYFVLAGTECWATVVPLKSTLVDKVPDNVAKLALRRAD